jgi:hypothetical protein
VPRIPLVVVALGAIVTLAGCAAPVPTPNAAAHAIAQKVVPVPVGVVGSGTLVSWNGKSTGTIEVLAKFGHFTFVLSDFSTDFSGQNIFALADSSVTMTQCGENNLYQIGLTTKANNAIEPTMSFDLPDEVDGLDDPSFWKTFLFLQYGTGTSLTRGCDMPIEALATIHWTLPDKYPGLRLVDHGTTVGARGTVTRKGGAPFTYATGVGDTWAAIAHRFGISGSELSWLSPIRHPDNVFAIAYAGQVLNLSPANRGNSETRRAYAQ